MEMAGMEVAGAAAAAITAFREGRMVLIVDDADRENEGDIAVAAEFATAEVINFMISHGRGLVCVPMRGERLDTLRLPPMVPCADPDGPAFTVSVDARAGTSSGTSAADRARTVQTLLDPRTTPRDLVRPGHVFPLRYREGGVLARRGHTEASVDLARLAGRYPAAVICEVLNPDGTMARPPDLHRFACRHGLPLITVGQIVSQVLSCRRPSCA